MDVAAKIKELAESALVEPGHFVVDVLYNTRTRPARLMIILDGDNGVTIDACAELSRKVSNLIDEHNLITDAFLLEVSTPGLDHPLKIKRQYYKNIGREIKVHLKDGSIFQGILEAVNDESLTIRHILDKKELRKLEERFGKGSTSSSSLLLDDIVKIFVMVSFKHN